MSIIVNLDVMMAIRKISSSELAAKIDLSQANLSILKNNKAKAIRFSTLEAICKALACQPGDILAYEDDDPIPKEIIIERGKPHGGLMDSSEGRDG